METILKQVRDQPKVKAYLQRKSRNSQNSADAYLQGLTRLQQFLNATPEYAAAADVNEIGSLFASGVSVYELLDSFISYLSTSCGLSANTVSLYVAAVKGYLENCDVEISPVKFKNKVTMPKNHREDEAAIDDSDIRKILLACNNFRLKVYLLILASGGLRAREACAIRLRDIDFSVTPTKIHVRKEYTKTKVSRDIYISEEATTYLKQFIERKYSSDSQRIRNEDDLVFRMHYQAEYNPKWMYNKILTQFQRLLKSIGMNERKDGMQRRKITFHSFRRFAKTVIANHTNTDYSEWFLGHSKSPYFVQKEVDRRLLYATKCMPFLTFINYSKLEQDASVKQTEVEMLMMKDANKDREIELLRQRDTSNTERIRQLEAKLKGSKKEEEDELKVMKEQLNGMQSQMQSLMSAFSSMKEQPQVDSMAKSLYSSGLLIKAAAVGEDNKDKEQLIKAAGKAAYHATRTKSALTREAEKAKTKSNAK